MDLHIVGGEPSEEERAAVDALLGSADSGWRGGARDSNREGRAARGGHETWADRHLLLPTFHAVQDHIGWISRGALNYICRRLTVPPAEAWGVLTFYHLLSPLPRPRVVAHVCDDIACRLQGAERICAELQTILGPPLHSATRAADGAEVPPTPVATTAPAPRGGVSAPPGTSGGASALVAATGWMRSPCLGQCDRAPAALVIKADAAPAREEHPAVTGADEVLRALERLAGPTRGDRSSPRAELRSDLRSLRELVPQAGSPDLKLLRRIGVVEPTSLADYRAAGGYQALARAVELGPQGVIAEVTASGLLGRGGAAFPTGRKWEAVAREAARPHYVVCNADESEPGTFKDRVLLAGDPFAIIEALTICGYATGAERGFI
ncbi:MAG: NAD(P)H-dependent oxidoreductase subunit E, partial [Acidobacteria bacterium]|nr:NAD(P)H-dependent oxidoreductase subunit E [Acidobacteriota bacterium]